MKKLLILIMLTVAGMGFTARCQDAAVVAYINKYKDLALEQESKYGVPAPITLAQGIVESGAGKSRLTRMSNNHFGIKAHKAWKGPVHYAKDDDPGLSPFRKYGSARESYEDHSKFLARENRGRYGVLFTYNPLDYRRWANGLKSTGYATDPNYALALIQYIERYQLYKLNGGVKLRPKSRPATRYVKRIKIIERVIEIPDMDAIEDDETTEEEDEYNKVMSLSYVAIINGVNCQRLYPGESLTTIARELGIDEHLLLEYNEVPNEDSFKEGDIVYLAPKKNKNNGSQAYYTVQEGDTWHSVSQLFGVNTAYLIKKNKKSATDVLVVGERLKLK